MAKVVIVSDSHGLKNELMVIKNRHQDADLFVHCGDSELTKNAPELAGFTSVKGNMDFAAPDLPIEAIELVGNQCLYTTHGHLYNVKMSHLSLAYRAEETGASIVCFGHSHIAEAFDRNGKVFINPGSIRLPRGYFEKTYAVCDVGQSLIKVTFMTLDGEPVPSLSKEFCV